MRILFTGASSFTGSAFVESLFDAGHNVVCPLRGNPEAYNGLRRHRVERLLQRAQVVSNTPFGSEAFLELLADGSWDLFCHHAAETADYRNPAFDPVAALRNNTRELAAVLDSFKSNGGKTVILTGSYFEAGEGTGESPVEAFSPYGLSKGLTWVMFRYYCHRAGVPLAKFVLPNPFGPWEEPRFTAYLMKTWDARQSAQVKTPDYIRDNIHIDLLAAIYARFAEQVSAPGDGVRKLSPSCYAEKQGTFARRVAEEVRERTGWPCGYELLPQTDFSEPMRRMNLDPAPPLVPQWNEKKAWDNFVEFYTRPKM